MRYYFALAIAACSSPGTKPIDAPSGDAGPCGADDFYTGEVVDWDSTEDVFCGVDMAELRAPAGSDESTNPNGRFQLCIPPADQTVVTVTPPSASSQCAPSAGTYQMPGLAIARHDVIATGQIISMRMIGSARSPAFFSQFGIALDPSKAIVYVHVDGTPGAVSSGAMHDAPLAFDGSAWGSGDTGAEVVFPNTAVGSNASAVGFTAGGGIGSGTFPVAAGTITYVTLVQQP